jgi:hypothetical protein
VNECIKVKFIKFDSRSIQDGNPDEDMVLMAENFSNESRHRVDLPVNPNPGVGGLLPASSQPFVQNRHGEDEGIWSVEPQVQTISFF